jgi:hypothetical protein
MTRVTIDALSRSASDRPMSSVTSSPLRETGVDELQETALLKPFEQ